MEAPCYIGLWITGMKAVPATTWFTALETAMVLAILGALMPLRVSHEEEERGLDRGLDFVSHGEEA